MNHGDENFPLVTVIIPCYNHERYVQQCIQSVIDQDYGEIELIIIDDGSSDASVDQIEEFSDLCLERFVRFEFRARANKGVASTLNEGIAWAKGEYLSFIASDDVLNVKKISVLMRRLGLLSSKYAAAFGDAGFINDESKDLYLNKKTGSYEFNKTNSNARSFLEFHSQKRDVKYEDKSQFGHYITLLGGNYLPAMSAVLRTDAVQKVGGFSEGIALEDWDLWLKLSKTYLFHFEPVAVAYYRLHGENTVLQDPIGLLLDSLELLEREKRYALENDCEDVFYLRQATSVLGLIKIKKRLLVDLYQRFFNYKFIKAVLNLLFSESYNVFCKK